MVIGFSYDMFDIIVYFGVCDKIVLGLLIGVLVFGYLLVVFVLVGLMILGILNK